MNVFFIYLFLPQGLVSLSILRFFLKRIRIIAGDAGFEQVQKSGALLMSHHISLMSHHISMLN